tara:strand:+ start:137 stop:265 length:129 start_codon:yes stop_codon:yes gene_type:complete
MFTQDEYDRFAEVVGSLMISQFKGEQEPYRKVINKIFETWEE